MGLQGSFSGWATASSSILPQVRGLGRVYPCISQAGAGWEHQASVTVRTHGRGTFSFPFGGLGLRIFFLLEGIRDRRRSLPGQWLATPHLCPPAPRTLAVGLTEALLEPDSSSALGGCAAFFRLRGLDRAAFLRLLGGLVEESSYSSAREKRSLNLRGTCFLR